jgi:hypothetical protein
VSKCDSVGLDDEPTDPDPDPDPDPGSAALFSSYLRSPSVRLIEMSDFLSEGNFSFLYLERWQITC